MNNFKIGDRIKLKDYNGWWDLESHKDQSAIIMGFEEKNYSSFDYEIKWDDGERSFVYSYNCILIKKVIKEFGIVEFIRKKRKDRERDCEPNEQKGRCGHFFDVWQNGKNKYPEKKPSHLFLQHRFDIKKKCSKGGIGNAENDRVFVDKRVFDKKEFPPSSRKIPGGSDRDPYGDE